jgi:hypothetical protein
MQTGKEAARTQPRRQAGACTHSVPDHAQRRTHHGVYLPTEVPAYLQRAHYSCTCLLLYAHRCNHERILTRIQTGKDAARTHRCTQRASVPVASSLTGKEAATTHAGRPPAACAHSVPDHALTHTRAHAYVHTRIDTGMPLRTPTATHTCTYACLAYTCLAMLPHICNAHTRIRAYTHTRIHAPHRKQS